MPGIQIGQVLVEQGALTQAQVARILAMQKMSHRPFGDLAERLYGINPRAIEDAWVEQYVRVAGEVDLEQQRVDAECLRELNRRQAWQFHMLPMNRTGEELNVATDAANLVRAVNFATRRIDETVYFQIADRRQLREFLMRHYPVPEHIARYAETLQR